MKLNSHNSIAVLHWSDEPGFPRLRRETLREFDQMLDAIEREPAFHGVVIASGDSAFATGADLQEVTELHGIESLDFSRLGQSLLDRIARFRVPVVAAIRSYCLGGGLDLALACHSRVASYDASFGHPGASLGLVTGWGGTQRLPRLIGKSAALNMLLTGERVPATQAFSMGLVDELVSSADLIASAARRAERLARGGSKQSMQLRREA